MADEDDESAAVEEVEPDMEAEPGLAARLARHGDRIHPRQGGVERTPRAEATALRRPTRPRARRAGEHRGAIRLREPRIRGEQPRGIAGDPQAGRPPEDRVHPGFPAAPDKLLDILRPHGVPMQADFVEKIDVHHDLMAFHAIRRPSVRRGERPLLSRDVNIVDNNLVPHSFRRVNLTRQ